MTQDELDLFKAQKQITDTMQNAVNKAIEAHNAQYKLDHHFAVVQNWLTENGFAQNEKIHEYNIRSEYDHPGISITLTLYAPHCVLRRGNKITEELQWYFSFETSIFQFQLPIFKELWQGITHSPYRIGTNKAYLNTQKLGGILDSEKIVRILNTLKSQLANYN